MTAVSRTRIGRIATAARTVGTILHSTVDLSAASQNPLIVTGAGGIETGSTAAIVGGPGIAWTIDNAGTVTSLGADAIDLVRGGLVSNTGTIGSGSGVGVDIAGGNATVVNAGRIDGATDAVLFSGIFNDLVVLDAGGVFAGAVVGGGAHNTLELATGGPGVSGALSGIGTNFVNFQIVDVDAGAVFWLGGDNALGLASQLTIAGTLDFDGGTGSHERVANGNFYGVPDPTPYGARLMDIGTITNTGSLGLAGGGGAYDGIGGTGGTGATLISAGLITNSGRIGLAGGGGGGRGGEYSPGGTGAVLISSGSLNNSGTITAGGGGGGGLSDSGGFPYEGDGRVSSQPGTGATLINSGQLTNTGMISALGGQGGGFNRGRSGGTGATLLNAGTLTNAGSIQLSAGTSGGQYYGDFSGGGGASLVNSGLLTNTGTINLLAVSYQKYVNRPAYDNTGLGASLIVSGRLNNSGNITLHANAGNIGYYGAGGGGSDALYIAATGSVTNTGTIYLHGGGSGVILGGNIASNGAELANDGYLANAGLIILDGGNGPDHDGGAELRNDGTLVDTGTIAGFGTLFDQGLLTAGSAGGTGGVISTSSFIADNVQLAAMTALTVTSATTSGVFALSAGSTLAFAGAGAVSGQVDFAAAGGLLKLGAPAAFKAVLAGVQAQTTIDFLRQGITGVSSFGTTLAIGLENGPTIDIALAQPLSGLALSLHSDGAGGTDLLFSASGG